MHRLYRRQTLCFLLLQSQIHAQQPQVLDDEDTPIVLAANNDTTFSTTNEPTFTTRIQNTGTAILLPSLDPDPHYRNPASQTTIPHASHLPRSEPITTLSDYIIGLTPGGTFTPEVVLVSGTPAAKPTPGAPGADSYTVKGNDREYLFKCRAPGPWKMCDGWPITSEICAKQCKCNSRLGMDEKGADSAKKNHLFYEFWCDTWSPCSTRDVRAACECYQFAPNGTAVCGMNQKDKDGNVKLIPPPSIMRPTPKALAAAGGCTGTACAPVRGKVTPRS